MSNVLMAASNEWSSRPADQRFSSLADLHAATLHHREVSVEAPNVDIRKLRVSVTEPTEQPTPEPVLIGSNGAVAKFNHHSFGQFARRVGAPASYLRTLPAALAAENLNHGIASAERPENGENLLFAQNGNLRLRAMVTPKYTRIWNSDISSRLIRLTQQSPEWQPAPAAFDGSRGLYASDSDMFAFLVDNDRRIFEKGPGGGLGRGFFVRNSEVGDGSFSVTTFFYEYICGNHRVWGASGVAELRIPHIGNADERAFAKLGMELKKYADSSAAGDEAKVESMQRFELGGTKDEVLDKVFGLRIDGLTRKTVEQAYDLVDTQRADWYGSPRTVWGLTGGITEIARDKANASERVALDKAAGKLMQIAF